MLLCDVAIQSLPLIERAWEAAPRPEWKLPYIVDLELRPNGTFHEVRYEPGGNSATTYVQTDLEGRYSLNSGTITLTFSSVQVSPFSRYYGWGMLLNQRVPSPKTYRYEFPAKDKLVLIDRGAEEHLWPKASNEEGGIGIVTLESPPRKHNRRKPRSR